MEVYFKMCYSVRETNSFKKDRRKLSKSSRSFDGDLQTVLKQLKEGNVDSKYDRHKLDGCFKGMQSVHIKGDCVLVFEVDEKHEKYTLHRVGSHANIIENRGWSKRY